MAAQHFFLGQTYLGQRHIPDLFLLPGFDRRFHFSYAFFCMRCGEIWGRLIHEKPTLTQCHIKPCLDHGNGRFSEVWFYPGECTNFEDDWPPAAVAHEFQAELRLAERRAVEGLTAFNF